MYDKFICYNLGLCEECSNKLNYKHKKKEVKRVVTKLPKSESKHSKSKETSSHQPTIIQNEATATSKTQIDNVWSEQLQIDDDKPREDDFENYLEQLFF